MTQENPSIGAAAEPQTAAPPTTAASAAGEGAASGSPVVTRTWAKRPAPWLWLLLVAFVGVLVWQWIDLRQRVAATQEQLARRLVEGAGQLNEARALAAAAQEAQSTQATRIAVLESRLAELHGQQGSLEGLYQELARGRDEWLLTEVDQLLTLAGQQLQLGGNAVAAIAALSTADARLARSERPQWVALRKAIGHDLQRLRALPQVDSAGIALRLENAALAVDQMTLAFEARPAARAKGSRDAREVKENPAGNDWSAWWQHWIGEIWQEVHQLIRIDRLDRPDPAVLAPQHAVFLRENLKLRLLGARLALLGRDQATFKGELRLATQWLERYFDPRDRLVGQTADALRPLLASDLNIEAPALNESLAALKAVKLVDARGDTRSGR